MPKIAVICFAVCVISAAGFNISPKPNLVIKEPSLKTFIPTVRSSYFGFSIVLRMRSVIIGAPRAQSSLEKQRKVNETGAIYKCSLQTSVCAPYVFDDLGNTLIENSEYTYDSEKKDNQWLGASMDGGPREQDRLVVCAPRRLTYLPNDYMVHGICFLAPDSSGDKPLNYVKISPLRLQSNQLKEVDGRRFFYHMFGQQGISVQFTENNEEIIMGAPGVHTWKGSIIRYRPKIQEDWGGLSRRDNSGNLKEKIRTAEFVSDVPNPALWEQPNDSYFGYAVASGYFEGRNSGKMLYVATAPQANNQAGEAYLFDIVKAKFGEMTISKYHVFRGTQFGEYFGYAVITEDVNGDGLTDVLISAPQYAIGMNYDKGAVYVFLNKGELNFDSGKVLVGPSDKPGRFGTTISKLGDINHDGFNDIAIGAPFEDNGAVYIYLGNERGMREKPSQILRAPEITSTYKPFMFGHGLSKGVDIDQNEFNDLAIGAPNAEAVLVYRSYPVVKIAASIGSPSRAISIDQKKIQIRACYQLETTSTKSTKQSVAFKVVVDPQVKRVKFNNGKNEIEFNDTVALANQCRLFEATVKFSLPDIFKPIELDMHFGVLNNPINSETFCDTCVAIDPSDPVSVSQKIVFSTGCKSDICVADLQLKSGGILSPYVIGSTKTIAVVYYIKNEGETAYLPQINITSSNQMPFAKIPSSCISDGGFLLCDLNQGHPLEKGKTDSITIVFDTTNIDGESMMITAEVFSTGNEFNSNDNEVIDEVTLAEYSEIESAGQSNTPPLTLEGDFDLATVTNQFEIRNNGPSRIKDLEITISIPTSYLIPGSFNRIPLVDFSNMTLNATYNGKPIHVEFRQNDTILIQNVVELSSTPSAVSYKIHDHSLDEFSVSNGNAMTRRRRSLINQVTDAEYARISQQTGVTQLSDDLVDSLPVNRTILFNCNNPEETLCVQAMLRVHNFEAGDNSVSIILQYNIDLHEVNKVLVEPKEFFVVTTSLDVNKIGDPEGKTFLFKKTDPHNIISKHQLYFTPIWVYVVSILGGILLLAIIIGVLYKMGFFRRHKKEELQKLYRQSQRENADETEDDE